MNNEEERSKQNLATQAPMEIESNTRFLAAALVEEKNTLESGFDFLFWIWFVHGFLGLGSGEWDGIWRERKGRTRKKIHVLAELKSSSKDSISIKQNQVLWAWFSWRKSESFGLDFQAYVDSVSSSAAVQWEIECNILDLYTKIESFGLNLLNTKIVSNLG